MKQLLYPFLFAVFLFLLAACAGPPMPTPKPTIETAVSPTADTINEETAVSSQLPILGPGDIALGQTVYAANCAECHGANLEGEAEWKTQNEDGSFRSPPHDETGHTWHHPDGQLLEAIKLGGARFEGMNIGGSSAMPAYGELLTDPEITAVLTYIKSNWPDNTREIQWGVSTRDQ